MEKTIKQISEAIKEVFRNRIYFLSFVLLSIILLFFYIYLPAKTIPGNSLKFQLEILGTKGIFLLAIFSMLSSLTLTMWIYNFLTTKQLSAAIGSTGAGIFAAFLSALLSTASCSYCLIAFFGFLGSGAIFFMLENRNKIVIISILLLLISIYSLSKKITEGCKSCKIKLQ